MKPGKGNSQQQKQPLSDSSTTKPQSNHDRKRTLSINGELINDVDFGYENVDLTAINIHDYAVFEKEHDLIPEFRQSIKNRKTSEKVRDFQRSDHLTDSSTSELLTKNISFQEVAKQVRTIERVLLKWPRRPLNRHHSSSSEDFPSEECEDVNITDIQCENVDKEFETSDYASENVDEREMEKDKSDVCEKSNTRDCLLQKESRDQVELQGDSMKKYEAADKVDDSGEGWGSSGRQISAVAEGGQTSGCGDSSGASSGVVLLGRHDGLVHASSPAPLPTPAPQTHSESGRKDVQSGKTREAASHSGCCSCVVL